MENCCYSKRKKSLLSKFFLHIMWIFNQNKKIELQSSSQITKHLRKENPTNIQKSTTPYECIACDKKFKTRIQCVKHLQNSDHQSNVRKNYPQTLFHTSDGLRLTGINVKLCCILSL